MKQEIWAAAQVQVMCGSSWLTWHEYTTLGPKISVFLSVAASVRAEHRPDLTANRYPNVPRESLNCLIGLRDKLDALALLRLPKAEGHDAHEILRLLNETVTSQVTFAHDRIYALLGMAGIPSSKRVGFEVYLPVDYSISLEALYRRLAMALMMYVGPWCILAADGRFGNETGLDLPSWTPNFVHPTKCKLLPSIRQADRAEDEQARLRLFRRLNPDVTSAVLRLEGFRIATST